MNSITRIYKSIDGTSGMSRDCLVFHPGTQHSWQTASAIDELGRLQNFATSIFYQPDKWPYKLEKFLPQALSARIHSEFRRFQHPSLDPEMVLTSGMIEWVERIVRRLGARAFANRLDAMGNQRFGRDVEHLIRSKRPRIIWGYDNSSLEAFRCANNLGIRRVLDRTNGDWRAYNEIMSQVHDEYPQFFLSSGFRVSDERIARNQEEFELADEILVGSEFAAETIRSNVGDMRIADRVKVVNYCFDERLFAGRTVVPVTSCDKPLKFLFVGQAGVRKGIHLVLKAFERIPASAAELTIVGDLQVPPRIFSQYSDRVRYIPTVARADIPSLMEASDILLFPSYFEGSALSLIEALASGMGIIQSRNAGCGATKESGIILRHNTASDLYDAIMVAVENRDLVSNWRLAALSESKKYTFARYIEAVKKVLDGAAD
jgi:glycosyltransferase involved in cell wall biosynthesis